MRTLPCLLKAPLCAHSTNIAHSSTLHTAVYQGTTVSVDFMYSTTSPGYYIRQSRLFNVSAQPLRVTWCPMPQQLCARVNTSSGAVDRLVRVHGSWFGCAGVLDFDCTFVVYSAAGVHVANVTYVPTHSCSHAILGGSLYLCVHDQCSARGRTG